MKIIFRILIVLVVLVVVILIGVQIFGVKYLKGTVDKFVLPKVEEITGVDASIEELSLNLFKGDVRLDGLIIGNPEGYKGDLLTVKEFETDVALKPLLKKEVYINDLTLKDVHLSIISKGAENINVMDVAKHIDKVSGGSGKETKSSGGKKKSVENEVVDAPSDTEAKEPVDFTLKNAGFNFLFSFLLLPGEYIKKEYQLDWSLMCEAKDITNIDIAGNAPGSLKIKSGLAKKPDEPVVDLDGIIYPLTDMSKPSFEISGEILNFNMLDIQEWCEFLGVGSENLSATLNLVCEKGMFNETSNIELSFKNPKLYGYLSKEIGNVELPDNINVKVPVTGTWDDPKIDIKPVLSQVILEVTKTGLINKYVPKEYRDATKNAGDSIEEGLKSLFK
ncbi:MAG: AsmA family protein [Kiritimatiellae bacterium]|jgi:hypothetical protein|nr:AsmA family protein [Kiritimatiellia bacterium]